MKKIYFALLFVSLLSFGQENVSDRMETTMKEYNYFSVGYKDHSLKSQDINKGYRVEEENWSKYSVNFINEKNQKAFRQITFINFYRDGEYKPCGIVMKALRSDTKVEVYFCIPAKNSSQEVWNRCFNDYEKFTANWGDIGTQYSWPMIRYISELSNR